jgi:Uncharacterised nucleotidyltransferase
MESDNRPPPSAILSTALVLRVDGVTREVVTAMRDAGIRTVLLKGPSTAAWLYGGNAARPYGDSDLLVAPGSYPKAGDVLRELGFCPVADLWHSDSQEWLRSSDASCVDLHRSLIGVLASPQTVWDELARETETLGVGGIEVEVLRIPARALHVALHAAQHGVEAGRPREDLTRALRLADERVWRQAGDLAQRIDAVSAFAAGLRLDPAGGLLAERLKLPEGQLPSVALRAGRGIPVAIALESLARERSVLVRARLSLRSLVPSPVYMRRWSAMHMTRWPAAVRGRPLGLAVAYLWRPIWILLRLPGAIAAFRRARRDQPWALTRGIDLAQADRETPTQR